MRNYYNAGNRGKVKMKQLSSQEFKIYKRYVLEQIENDFNKIGTLDIEYLDKVIGLEYEISDVTNLIYPKIKFYDTFDELQTLSKIELHNKPNDLLEKYRLQILEIPVFSIYDRRSQRDFTPYNEIENIQSYIDKYIINFYTDEKTILTDGKEKKYDFIDKNKNLKTYLLPMNYENKNGMKLYEHYRQLKTELKNIVDNIEPIDGQKLYDLIIKYYKN